MFKKFIPYGHAKSIYEIEPEFFKKHGVKILFVDLDNTLDSYKARRAKENTINYIKSVKGTGVKVVIVSNNKAKRVCMYAADCDVPFIASARKPFGKKLKNELLKLNVSNDEAILVGDQMMTDVLAGRNSNIRVILTEKLVKEDQWTTHFNRIMDRPIRAYHRKHSNLRDWREI